MLEGLLRSPINQDKVCNSHWFALGSYRSPCPCHALEHSPLDQEVHTQEWAQNSSVEHPMPPGSAELAALVPVGAGTNAPLVLHGKSCHNPPLTVTESSVAHTDTAFKGRQWVCSGTIQVLPGAHVLTRFPSAGMKVTAHAPSQHP